MSARIFWRGINPSVRLSQSEALLFDRVVASSGRTAGYALQDGEREDADYLLQQGLVIEYQPGYLVRSN